MGNFTTELIVKALDGLYARQTVTAQNIANANSPGYRAMRVSFEDSLKAAAASGRADLADVTPQMSLVPEGEGLRLDLEIATASQTALRFGALLSVLEGRGGLMRTVIEGGR
ncbi:flagellar basal body rod protein FlgB [Sphingosinithalassobacter portus]|uniref:flagellar basal body rod protein FlgB n=1 Tax=Stakelama portus TaxID=2676234 RepID=UPI000D6DFC6A|nr:flagellar basal body protein [Sphingosinithalassobacter portus]